MNKIKAFLFIFLLGLFLGLMYIYFFALQKPYGHEYQDIAKFIAEGKGYIGPGFFKYSVRPTSFLAPVYTYILAFSFIIFGFATKNSFLFIYFIQACSFALTAVLFYYLINEYFSNKSAIIFTALYFTYIPLYSTILSIWDTSLLVLLFAIAAFTYFKFIEKNSIPILILLATLLGAGILLNPVSIVIIVSAIIHYFIYGGIIKKWKVAIILITFPVLLLVPWTIRNYVVHKTFVPVRTGLGLNLYLGNNINATGTVYLKINGKVPNDFEAGITHNFFPFVTLRWQKNNFSEIQEDRDLTKEFIYFVKHHPLDYIKLFFRKIFYFLWKNPYQKDSLDPFQIWYGVIVFLSFLYIFFIRFKDKKVNFIYLNCFFLTLIYAFTGPYFNWKYRFPIEPFLIMFASIQLVYLRNKYIAKSGL